MRYVKSQKFDILRQLYKNNVLSISVICSNLHIMLNLLIRYKGETSELNVAKS